MKTQALLRNVKDDFFDLATSLNSWRFWRTLAMMTVGLTLMSLAINGVLIPHHLNASGATGIALSLYYFFGKPSVGVYYWLINVPILIVGWRAMSLKFVFLAIVGVAISGASLQLTHGIVLPCHDQMMAAVMAGTLSGLGVGLYLRYGGSAGGLDIVAAVLRRKMGIPMGQTFIGVNALNVLAAGLLSHSLEVAFYSAIAVFVHSRMVDRMQSGFSARKAAFIITREPDKLASEILRTLRRGCTFFFASGGMTQQETRVIYTVVNFIELARLKEILYHMDPTAFLAVHDTTEVIGNRFISWEEEGFVGKRRPKAAPSTVAHTPGAACKSGVEAGTAPAQK